MYSIIVILFMFTSFLYLSECRIIEDLQKGYEEGDRFVYFPDGQGNVELIDLNEPLDERIIYADVRSMVTFNLITRNNPDAPQIIKLGDLDGLKKSHFTIGKTTAVLSHGWRSAANDMEYLVDEFLADDDVNVINVDWYPVANNTYVTAQAMTLEVGVIVGDFVNWLVSCGVSYDEVHMVGISLGGQMVGSAGRQTQGRVKKITGLDPAGPLWYVDRDRLQSTDAQFVEVIHTNTAFFGYKYPCGDVDIYPDGGAIVTACQSIAIKNFCSHVMSLNFFIVSLRYPDHFVARKCRSYFQATNQICDGQPYVFGTSDLIKTGSGIYRMETEETYPY